MALAIFTAPLCVAFNFVCGGWIIQTERLVSEAREVFQAVKGLNESFSYVALSARSRDEYMDKRMSEQDGKLNGILSKLTLIQSGMDKVSEGQSPP